MKKQKTVAAKPEPKPVVAKPEPKPRARKYDPSYVIRVVKKDMPAKKNGRNPYVLYQDGLTIGELLKLGVKPADLWYDSTKTGAIEIVRPS